MSRVRVPIYAIASMISLYSLNIAFFLDALRDIYEAFVILCFFTLLVEYLGKTFPSPLFRPRWKLNLK